LTNMKVNTTTWAYNLTSNGWNWLTDANNQFSFNAVIDSNDWTLTSNARALKAYPNLFEYIWQKNASMAPNGLYDKIGLHRLIKTGVTLKGVVLILPGTYGSGEFLASNPTTDNYTMTENESQAVYWANRDYDVYAMDYRTHFVPDSLNPLPPGSLNSSKLSFMSNWGWDQWMSDINEAVNKVKEMSGAASIFMGGQSFGGRATMNYAATFPLNVRGIILMDGGNASRNTTPTNTYNLTAALAQENVAQNWYLVTPALPGSTPLSTAFKYLAQYALANPGAPAFNPYTNTTFGPPVNPLTNKTFANITEVFGFIMQSAAMTNTTGGYMKASTLIRTFATMDMFWPDRLNLEYNAYMNWNNCPYVTRDFDDNFQYVNVPLIGFTSQLYGLPRAGPVGNIANPDVTKVVLSGYGHLDVFEGLFSARDVSEPAYQWMNNRMPAPPLTPTPVPTQQPISTPAPTAQPTTTPASTPTATAAPTAAPPSQTPTPTSAPTPAPTSTPTNTNTPRLTQAPTIPPETASPSPDPTSTSNTETFALSTEATYAIAAAIIIAIIVAIAIVIKRKEK
jgi:pimeloyl-ACP methyl ester carboxylesterase